MEKVVEVVVPVLQQHKHLLVITTQQVMEL
jgi:hypothetical protein